MPVLTLEAPPRCAPFLIQREPGARGHSRSRHIEIIRGLNMPILLMAAFVASLIRLPSPRPPIGVNDGARKPSAPARIGSPYFDRHYRISSNSVSVGIFLMTSTFQQLCREADKKKKAAETNGKKADDGNNKKPPKQADILIGFPMGPTCFTPRTGRPSRTSPSMTIARRIECAVKHSGNGFGINISNRQRAASTPTRCKWRSRRSPPRRCSRAGNTKSISESPSTLVTSYIDIGDASWRAIKVSKTGWEMVAKPR